MSLLVVIPSYNEGINVERTVNSVRSELPQADIIVIDDSEEIESLDILRRVSAKVIHRKIRSGQNTAYNLGAEYCLNNGYSSLLFLEADLVLDASALRDFVNDSLDSDLSSCACYPLEPRSVISYAYGNFVKVSTWIRMNRKRGIMPSRIILLKSELIKALFPIPDSFLDPTSWMTGKCLQMNKRVSVSWQTGLFFVVPQTLEETLDENARAKYSSEQIKREFPEIASKQSSLIINLFLLSLRHPKYLLSWPWLARAMLGVPNYDKGTHWQMNQSTKKVAIAS